MRISENAEPSEGKPGLWRVLVALFLLVLLPLDCAVTLALLCAELLGRLCRRQAPRIPPVFTPPRPECSFVIVTWNSQSQLAESLPPLLQAIREYGGNHEVILLDNHSSDGTVEYIGSQFPEVRIVRTQENVYFGAGSRLGVAAATRDIAVLMNSDTAVRPGFLEPLLQAFEDSRVFGVASQVCGTEGETGYTQGDLRSSHIGWQHRVAPNAGQSQTYPVLWLHRGLFAVDRRKYLWLGPPDSLYDPLFFEDLDLSYRAWKVGWTCLLATNSHVCHHHHVSVPASGEGFLHLQARRNEYIFSWKNINDLSLIASQGLSASAIRLRRACIPAIGMVREIRSFLGAVERLPRILMRRVTMSRSVMRTDRQIFRMTREPVAASVNALPTAASVERSEWD